MSHRKIQTIFVAATALVVGFADTLRSTSAATPQGRSRTFMVVNAEEDFPDLESVASQFVVTHAGQGSNDPHPQLATADCSPLFPGGTWHIGGYITHVTADGPTTLFVYWLDEIPPSGAIAYTGLQGEAIGETVWVRQSANGECDTSGWIIDNESPCSQCHVRLVVTGWFSR